jgi:amino acid transporter
MVDGKLLVEPDAVLPRYLFLGNLGFMVLFGYLGFPAVSSYFSISILVAIIGAIGTSLIGRSLMVHVFLTRQTRRRQALSYWLLLGTVVLLLSLMFLAANFSGAGDWMLNIISAASLVAIFAAIVIRWRQRRLYWRKGPDHRKEMRGLHPRAIELLEATAARQRA